MITIAGMAVAALLLQAPPKSEAAAGLESKSAATAALGQPVAEIVWQVDGPLPAGAAELVSIPLAKPLASQDVAATLRHLYASGHYEDAAVYAENSSRGVVVTIALTLVLRVESVRVEGGAPLDAGTMRGNAAIKKDSVLNAGLVEKGRAAIEAYLRKHGYHEGQVASFVERDHSRHAARILYRVVAGTPTPIAEIRFEGAPEPFTFAGLLAKFQTRVGTPYREEKLNKDLTRLLAELRREGYRKARAEILSARYVPEGKAIAVRVRIDVGSKVEFRVVGAKLSRLKSKKLLPFLDEAEFDEDLLSEASERLRDDYQHKGYYTVKVTYSQFDDAEKWIVLFVITPGRRYAVRSIDFAGNAAFGAEELRRVMVTRPRKISKFATGRLIDEELRDDLDAVLTFYNLQGYDQAEVDEPNILLDEAAGAIDIVVPVREGRHVHVESIALDGGRPELEVQIRTRLRHQPGEAYVASFAGDDVAFLRSFYGNRGYVDAGAEVAVEIDPVTERARLRYSVTEGSRVTIDKILVQGNTFTKRSAFDREIDLAPGDPYSYSRLLDVQRNLYRLGIFSKVRVTAQQEEGVLGERDVIVEVEEGKNLSTSYAIGYDTDDRLRATLGLSHSNLFGTRRYLGGQVRVSAREERWNFSYKEPYFFSFDIPILLTVFEANEERRGYTLDRRGVFLEFAKQKDPRRRLALRYGYEIINIPRDSITIPIDDIERQNRDIAISSLTPAAIWDSRDDPIDPRTGFLAAAELEYAFPLLNADASFFKASAQYTYHRPFGGRLVLAASARLGAIEPLASYISVPGAQVRPNERIPINERFFAGGPVSNRAYDRDALGIPGETLFAGKGVGGNGLVLVNLEARFPIIGDLGGVVFADSGNVWADYRDVALGEIKTGVGVGLRYATPIGPLRVEYGYKLDRQPGEEHGAIYLAIGNPF